MHYGDDNGAERECQTMYLTPNQRHVYLICSRTEVRHKRMLYRDYSSEAWIYVIIHVSAWYNHDMVEISI